MQRRWARAAPWFGGWALVAAAGALLIVRLDIAQRREAFQADARIAHRVLSQQAVQHEAILATLALLGTPGTPTDDPARRLPALYPQVLAVQRHDAATPWPEAALQAAEDRSRALGHASLGPIDAAAGRYSVVQAGRPASFALRIDARRPPGDEWPLRADGPVRALLVAGDSTIVLQPGAKADLRPSGLTEGFVFAKTLAAPGQPFELRLQRATGPAEWPWLRLALGCAGSALATAALASWQRARDARRRAEALLRVGQVARLNTLGELAAGVAHELNQPLAAVLANTQAARRLLADEPPELASASQAMAQAATQARRAADVVARLRRLVETPDVAGPRQPLQLEAVARGGLDLLEPEIRRRGIDVTLTGHAPAVLADPVALEQIVHNLVSNALQALDEVPAGERRLALAIGNEGRQGVLRVRDSGPGFTAEALPRLFEPFYSTRRGGLGLGLSLCQTLAQAMHGTLSAHQAEPRGAELRLGLPLADASTTSGDI